MRKIYTFITAVLVTASVFQTQQANAQSPQKMSYQAVIRNSSNTLLTNTQIRMKINIRQGSISGTVVYTETQTPTTNTNGLVSIEIGGGAGFNAINWAAGPYFLETNTDPTGGTNYSITGTSQLLSVPYALHAKTAESLTGSITETDPKFTAWDKDYNSLSNKPTLFSGSYTDLTNKPTVDGSETKLTAGTNVSVTGSGTAASPYVINASSDGSSHYIGEQYGGGVIFHLWKDNAGVEHGLIVALTDQSISFPWSDVTTLIDTSAQSSWDGLSNSNAIVGQAGQTISAAKLCLNSESGGKSDWYLPSIIELNMLWNNFYTVARALSQIRGATQIAANSYWSSTEEVNNDTWSFAFSNGTTNTYFKSATLYVRAVRSF